MANGRFLNTETRQNPGDLTIPRRPALVVQRPPERKFGLPLRLRIRLAFTKVKPATGEE